MGSTSKIFALFLTIIFGMSCLTLLVVKPASAQTATLSSIPTPSIPEFTLQLAGPAYTVPTTYYLNQSSGQIEAQIGYTNPYSYVIVKVKNQPFTPYTDSSGHAITFYYDVRVKYHNQTAEGWHEVYMVYNGMTDSVGLPTQSGSEYTSLYVPIYNGQEGVGTDYSIPVGAQTDVQVDAMIGYVTEGSLPPGVPPIGGWPEVFEGETSAWSSTQTVTVPANTPLSPTPAPSSSSSTPAITPTSTSAGSAPSSSSLLLITTVALVVIAFLLAVIIALLLYVRKRNRLLESSLKGLTKANTRSMRAHRVNRTNIRNRLMIGCPATQNWLNSLSKRALLLAISSMEVLCASSSVIGPA